MATKASAKTSKAAPAKSASNASKAAAPVRKEALKKEVVKKAPGSNAANASKAKSAPAKETSVSTTPKAASEKKALKVKKSYIVLFAALVLLAIAAYAGRGLLVAAVVNGQPISRLSVVDQAEKQVGKQTLSNLVRNTLIEQEAKRQNVSVSDEEIDAEIKKLEDSLSKQGQKLDQVLEVQGMTKEDLRRLIRLDKLVAKMVGKDVKVTDKEVDEYVEKNKDLLPQDQDEKELKKQIKERLQQQKTTEKVKGWLEDLQNKANVIYFVQY